LIPNPLQTPELASWLFLAGIIVVVVAGDKPKARSHLRID
jgi:hypothetical protein